MKNLNDQEQKVLVKANELSQLLKERGIPYFVYDFVERFGRNITNLHI